jgi:DNA uptake protein ComE-like DNA-binding protein
MRTFLRTLSLAASLAIAPALMAQAKPAAKAPAAAAAAAPAAAAAQTIDINTATAAELEAFPGIGKATSAKIIKGRPYANKAQLVSKKVMTQAVYDKIKDKLIAKQ